MPDTWDVVLEQLKKRDILHDTDAEYIKAFEQIAYLKAAALKPDTERYAKENSHLHEETESLMTRLNMQTMKLEGANQQVEHLTQRITERDAKIRKLEAKLANISDALNEKNKLFDLLNDEQLISQIQQNVMREKIAELEKKLKES